MGGGRALRRWTLAGAEQAGDAWAGLRPRVIGVAVTLMFRDFAGIATLTLASVYLQKAHHYSVGRTGFVVGTMMLLSSVVNPLAVYLTPGRRRLPALSAVLVGGGVILACVPFAPVRFALLVLAGFQTFQMASYAISDAGMLERVSPAVRGRVVGLFLSIAGTFASFSPWVMGVWTDLLGARASMPLAYVAPFATLGLMMMAAALATPLIGRLGVADDDAITPLSEVSPATMETVI